MRTTTGAARRSREGVRQTMARIFAIPEKSSDVRLRHIPWLLSVILLGIGAALFIDFAIASFAVMPILAVLWLRDELTNDILVTIVFTGTVEAAVVLAYWYMTKPEKEQTEEYRREQSLLDTIENLEQKLKQEKEVSFEARVRCAEFELVLDVATKNANYEAAISRIDWTQDEAHRIHEPEKDGRGLEAMRQVLRDRNGEGDIRDTSR